MAGFTTTKLHSVLLGGHMTTENGGHTHQHAHIQISLTPAANHTCVTLTPTPNSQVLYPMVSTQPSRPHELLLMGTTWGGRLSSDS